MERLTRLEFERLRFVSEGLLGRLSDDEIKRCGDKDLATLAVDMRCALAADDDDKIVEAGDALRAALPAWMLFSRPMPRRVSRR